MAAIDSNIALGVKPIQIENPINQYAAISQLQGNQQANQLGAMKMQEYERGLGEENKLRTLLGSGINLDSPEAIRQVYSISPKLGGEFEKNRQAIKKDAIDLEKTKTETTQKKLDLIRQKTSDLQFNPSNENIIAHAQDGVLNNAWSKEQADQFIAKSIAIPMADRPKQFALQGLDAEKRVTSQETSRHNLQTENVAKGNLAVNQGNLNLANQKFKFDTDPTAQGNMAAVKKRAEETVKSEVQGKIDVIANRKALQQAGYDPTTGKDDITNLIKESTGSYIGKGIDIGARLYGGSTDGSKALAQLEQKGNAITFGLLNGKLGAGISTSDRQFIESLVSRMSDGTLPVDDRLAAWGSAKNMMKTLGMVEELTTPNKTKSGSTTSNW